MKTNQIDVVPFTMFSHLEQIEHAQETRLSRQLRSNLGKPDQWLNYGEGLPVASDRTLQVSISQ